MIAKLKALHYNEYGFHVSKGDMDMKFMKKLLVASLAMVCAFGVPLNHLRVDTRFLKMAALFSIQMRVRVVN